MGPQLLPQSPPNVSIQVDERYADQVDADDLAYAVMAALAAEGRPEGEVTLVITGDEEIQALNLQYLAEDRPTDVLSFPATGPAGASQEETPGFVSAPEAASYLGDIIIAFPFASRQAAALGRDLAGELRLLAVHGVLHLLGYDHVEPAEEAAMWARQDAILSGLPGRPLAGKK